jgi:serine O-acetyltransferase
MMGYSGGGPRRHTDPLPVPLGRAILKDAARVDRRGATWITVARLSITSSAFSAALLYRLSSAAGRSRPSLGRLLSRVNLVVNGADIDHRARIGAGVLLQHPVGTVIGTDVRIGSGATFMSGVVLGRRDVLGGPDAGEYPTVGDGVLFGAHAVALGPVQIGDGARIGAHALVLSDVPSAVSVVGVPARPVRAAEDA